MSVRRLGPILLSALFSVCLLLLLPCSAAALEPGSYEVTTEKLHFRTGPSTESDSQYLLGLGAEITVVSFDGAWAYAEHQTAFGYVHTDYIAFLKPLPVAQEPDAESPAPEGQTPVPESPEIASPPVAQAAAPDPGPVQIGMVVASSLNFREQPNTDCAVLEVLPYGTVVEYVRADEVPNPEAQGTEWIYISFNSVRGYVFGEYLAAADADGKFPHEGEKTELVAFARQHLGVRYRYGGSSPAGFDCGGYVRYVYANFGVDLPMGATSQYRTLSHKIPRDQLQTGDLVFFRAPGTRRIGHVGIYIGDGRFIHATRPGDVVSVDTLSDGYYQTYYYDAARIG